MSLRSGRKKIAQGVSTGNTESNRTCRGAGETGSDARANAHHIRDDGNGSPAPRAAPSYSNRVPGLAPCPLPTSHGITRGPGNEEPAGRESRAPTARPNPSPGQRPGNEIPIKTFASPAGAAQTACRQRRLGRPCRARLLFYRGTQGVALGWDWAAPPALWTVGAGHGREMWVMSRACALGSFLSPAPRAHAIRERDFSDKPGEIARGTVRPISHQPSAISHQPSAISQNRRAGPASPATRPARWRAGSGPRR